MLVQRAIRERWPMDSKARRDVAEFCIAVVRDTNATFYHRLAASKVLANLDAINVRDEANRIQERGNELAAGQAALREAMRSPEGREALANLSQTLCNPALPTPSEPNPSSALMLSAFSEMGSEVPIAPIPKEGIASGEDKAAEPLAEGAWGASYGADRDHDD